MVGINDGALVGVMIDADKDELKLGINDDAILGAKLDAFPGVNVGINVGLLLANASKNTNNCYV